MTAYFETQRLFLRSWYQQDTDTLADINASPLVMEFFPDVCSYDETVLLLQENEKHFDKYGYGFYAIERKDNSELIGFAGLKEVQIALPGLNNVEEPLMEIKWRIGHRHWGKGFAPEAAVQILNASFSEFNLEQVFAYTSKYNVKSISVIKKIGMNYLKEFMLPQEQSTDPHVLYQIMKNQFSSTNN